MTLRNLALIAVAGSLALLPTAAASAATAIFSYSVEGSANPVIDPVTLVLSYTFVPFAASPTPFGPLTVTYSGNIDLTQAPPNGPTTALWDLGPTGTFFGPGVEFLLAVDPQTGLAPFYGTSTITGGTGIFAGATGSSSYRGVFNVPAGTATFVERVTISGPNVPAVPEPASWMMMVAGFGLVGAAIRRRRVPQSLVLPMQLSLQG